MQHDFPDEIVQFKECIKSRGENCFTCSNRAIYKHSFTMLTLPCEYSWLYPLPMHQASGAFQSLLVKNRQINNGTGKDKHFNLMALGNDLLRALDFKDIAADFTAWKIRNKTIKISHDDTFCNSIRPNARPLERLSRQLVVLKWRRPRSCFLCVGCLDGICPWSSWINIVTMLCSLGYATVIICFVDFNVALRF